MGGKFGKLTHFKHLVKEIWRINRSANRLLIINNNLDGFSLANHGRFAKFANVSPPPKFPSIQYLASSHGCVSFALCCLQFMLLMITSGMLNYQRLCGLRLHPFGIKACSHVVLGFILLPDLPLTLLFLSSLLIYILCFLIVQSGVWVPGVIQGLITG